MVKPNYFDEPIAARYDESSTGMYDPAVLEPAVGFLADLAGDGAALEFAVGTGRVALPLSRRGVQVHGIDLSEAMVRLRNAAAHLEPGGAFVIEVEVPQLQRLPPGETARPFLLTPSHLGFDEYDVVTQRLVSHHYWISDDGTARTVAMPFRYVWPTELDLMARLAGLELKERWGGWRREPFTADSRSHVSVWVKPSG